MKVNELVEALNLKPLSALDRLGVEVSGGYTSDLLSDVMANSREKNVWITLQTHPNVVAVAKLRDLAAIILVNSRRPEPDTLKASEEEKIPLLTTEDSAFTVSWKIHSLLGETD